MEFCLRTAGKSPHAFRKSILGLHKGDLVICSHGEGERRRIYAIGIVADNPSGQTVPRRLTRTVHSAGKQAWPVGWEALVNYSELNHPVLWPPIRDALRGRFTAKHYTDRSSGVQGYLFPVSADTAGEILRLVNQQQPLQARLIMAEATDTRGLGVHYLQPQRAILRLQLRSVILPRARVSSRLLHSGHLIPPVLSVDAARPGCEWFEKLYNGVERSI